MTTHVYQRAPRVVPTAEARAASCSTVVQLPSCLNLELYEGDDLYLDLLITDPAQGLPVDLTGGVVKAQIRSSAASEDVLIELEASIDQNITNVIHLHLPHEMNHDMPSGAVWDCQIDMIGNITTLVAGTVAITQEVTRDASDSGEGS